MHVNFSYVIEDVTIVNRTRICFVYFRIAIQSRCNLEHHSMGPMLSLAFVSRLRKIKSSWTHSKVELIIATGMRQRFRDCHSLNYERIICCSQLV